MTTTVTLAAALDAQSHVDATTTAPPPWSDVADVIWRRSLAEQHAAMHGDETTHDEPNEEG